VRLVSIAEVRRMVTAHNGQRAADDAVYKAQSEEIHRLGRLLEAKDAELAVASIMRAREAEFARDRVRQEYREEIERARQLVDEANQQRISENHRMQRLVFEVNRLRIEERAELEQRATGSGGYVSYSRY
jgi:hypothetical protein